MTPRESKLVEVLTLRLPKDVHEALRTLAFATDTSMNDIMLEALREHMGTSAHREAVTKFLAKAQRQYRVALDKLADL
jgi:predicted transcriptional regulator